MNKIVLTGFIALLFFVSCSKQVVFVPSDSGNPWKDDYKSVSKMENYREWGTYNVHDPACQKLGEYYYMYSTDAVYFDFSERRSEVRERTVPPGYIHVRRSKDLVNWEFTGWAFPEIPDEAVQWVRSHADGKGAVNIWAPYITQHGDTYRLYYCVSAFGRKASYLGLAESASPEGPWIQKGCVVKTNEDSRMNAIDPTIVTDAENGKIWMCYGSFFGGLYGVELNPETGLTRQAGDEGHLIARRANYRIDNLEAPEIIYHPGLKKYFLFVSYDPLMTTYNVRVGRSDKPEGPYFDFTGQNLSDTTNNFPILTAPYRFENHPGWAGTGHCGVLMEEDGRCFMFHQGRLSPQNAMMDLHVRQVFFTPDGWPVVSPERYTGSQPRHFNPADLTGEWEVIRVLEPVRERQLEAGQVLAGEGGLNEKEWNRSVHLVFAKDGIIQDKGKWNFSGQQQLLNLDLEGERIDNIFVFPGQDWENEKETLLFTGLDKKGRSVWGKRIK
jgi:arabinan endo-1,5-alpha-L-arabinosidase